MEKKDTVTSRSDSEEQQMQGKVKESCMVSFRLLHSHLKTFTGTMLLNLDHLEKQLDKEEFQEIGSMDAFRVLKTQFQTFINLRSSFDNDDGLMIRKYFLPYTRTKVQQFRDTLIQHMESIKKSIDERAQHKREYDNRVNERQMQTKEGKVDSSKVLDASLVVTKSSGTESGKRDTRSRSRNYITHAVDANIRQVNDQEPFAEVQLTAQHNVLANKQQHFEQSEPIYDTYLLKNVDSNTTPNSTNICNRGGEIDQNVEKCQVTSHLLDPLTQPPNTSEQSYQSLESENISLKKTVA
ncbi:hypothetical protein Tco_0226506 [Tanacetum coccineum]